MVRDKSADSFWLLYLENLRILQSRLTLIDVSLIFFYEVIMINKALKIIRQFHKLKQSELADKFSMSKSYLSEIESGKKPASFELLEKYSTEFDIPASSLVFFSESLSGKKGVSEKFRSAFSGQILEIMEWFVDKDETKKTQA